MAGPALVTCFMQKFLCFKAPKEKHLLRDFTVVVMYQKSFTCKFLALENFGNDRFKKWFTFTKINQKTFFY